MAINPLQAPINYAVDVKSPFEAALGGLQIGAGLEQMDVARQKRAMEMQQLQAAQAGQAELRNLFNNPNATSADYARVSAFLPKDQAAIVTQAFERKTKEQQQADLRMGGEVYSAIKSGNIEVAKQRLSDKATALRNSGRESEAKAAENSLELINLNPTAAQATIGLYMAQLPGGKEFLENADKTLSTTRTEAEAPAKLRQALAAAQETEAKAKVAAETAVNDIAKAEASRKFEQAKARREEAEADLAAGTVKSRIAKAELEAKPAPGFAIIPEAERTSLGLPAGVYQRNLSTQKIEPVSKELVRIDMGQQRDTLALKELDIPRAQEFSASAASARSLARDSKVIADLLKGKGGGATVKLTADFAKTLGFETETVRANDLANSLAIRGATQLRPPGSGSTSDTEFKAFVSAFPSLANSEGGRELMAKYADAFAIRSAKLADHARKLIREDRYSEEEIARFDTSLGAILKDDFYQRPGAGARASAAAAPAPAIPPAASAAPAMPPGFRVIR